MTRQPGKPPSRGWGGVAYNFDAPPRATKDIDVWIHPTLENAAAFLTALGELGFAHELEAKELVEKDKVLILGRRPNRIDALTKPDGIVWDACWHRRVPGQTGGVSRIRELVVRAARSAPSYATRAYRRTAARRLVLMAVLETLFLKRFGPGALRTIDATKYFYLRAGEVHRFMPVWVVVVEGRVIVRPWNNRREGWYRAFHENRAVKIGARVVTVRARGVANTKLWSAVDAAYGSKYTTRANARYVRGFATSRRRRHTLELLPVPSGGGSREGLWGPSRRSLRSERR